MSTCGATAAPVSRHPKTDPPKPGSSRAASECETWAGRRERGALLRLDLGIRKKGRERRVQMAGSVGLPLNMA